MSKDDPQVSAKAYEIWEAEGRPHGRDRDHWLMAEAALAAAAKPKTRRAAPKPAGAKPAKAAAARPKAGTAR